MDFRKLPTHEFEIRCKNTLTWKPVDDVDQVMEYYNTLEYGDVRAKLIREYLCFHQSLSEWCLALSNKDLITVVYEWKNNVMDTLDEICKKFGNYKNFFENNPYA